jgi:hypothetical protein
MKFIMVVFILGLWCCYGIEGTKRKVHAWGKESRETANRVSCELNREACDYIKAVRARLDSKEPRKLVRRRPARTVTEEQLRELNERGQQL